MGKNFNSLNPADFWPMATKAVASYIGKRYSGVFTSEDIQLGRITIYDVKNAYETITDDIRRAKKNNRLKNLIK